MVSMLVSEDGRFTAEGTAALAPLFQRLSGQAEPKLLLHFHGGLVSDAKGRDVAAALDAATAFGGLADAGWERSYLVWRTGLFEALEDRFRKLDRDRLFQRIVDQVLKWAGARVLEGRDARGPLSDGEIRAQRAVAGEPFSDVALREPEEIAAAVDPHDLAMAGEEGRAAGEGDPLRQMTERDLRVRALASQLSAELQARDLQAAGEARGPADPEVAASLALLDDDVLAEAGAEVVEGEARGGAASALLAALGRRAAVAGYRVLKRFLAGRDHGLYCTVVEEVGRAFYAGAIGTGVWKEIKEDADAHLQENGAGSVLLEQLEGLAEAKAPNSLRLLVTAHSAGAILACQFVREAARLPANVVLDLVFLAPAVRIDVAADSIAAANAKVNAIRIFTMNDELERKDDLDGTPAGKLYPRSLLYLVSGLFEDDERGKPYADAPLLGLQRHVDLLKSERLSPPEVSDRETVLAFLNGAPSRWILSEASGGEGLNTRARSHGSFDRDTDTLASIVHVAGRGY